MLLNPHGSYEVAATSYTNYTEQSHTYFLITFLLWSLLCVSIIKDDERHSRKKH